eukprot:3705942-Rhodomonas_salina.1
MSTTSRTRLQLSSPLRRTLVSPSHPCDHAEHVATSGWTWLVSFIPTHRHGSVTKPRGAGPFTPWPYGHWVLSRS